MPATPFETIRSRGKSSQCGRTLLLGASVFLSLSLAGCGLGSRAPLSIADSICISPSLRPLAAVPEQDPAKISALRDAGYSAEVVSLASAIGVVNPLHAVLEADRNPRDRLEIILARQNLNQDLTLTILEIQSTLAALHCQSERAAQLRDSLDQREARVVGNLALAGVVVGAWTSLSSGGLGLLATRGGSDVAGIVGGSVGAVLAGMQLYVSPQGRLRLEQNMLEEIWAAPSTPLLFPPRVWSYLVRRETEGQLSIRDQVIADWRSSGLLNDDDMVDGKPRLFLTQHVFDTDDLMRLDAMLDQLNARIALMNRDLRYLLEEVARRPTLPMRRAEAQPRRAT